MADVSDVSFFEYDFDTVLEIIDAEEDLDEQFSEAVIEVSHKRGWFIVRFTIMALFSCQHIWSWFVFIVFLAANGPDNLQRLPEEVQKQDWSEET